MRVGAVDIGTNSVRLLVADGTDGGLRWVEHRVVVTGLGTGVDASHRLAPDRIERTLDVLAGYQEAAQRAGVERLRAVATSAVRDAVNRESFLDAAEEALGIPPEVITGDEEGALSFSGATGGLESDGSYLVIDPGGGSTEFVLGTDTPERRVSVDIGSVRLTDRSLPDRPADPIDVLAASADVDRLFADLAWARQAATVIGVGGTFTSLGAIALDLPDYDRLTVHRSVLGIDRLREMVTWLATLSVEETAAIPSLDPKRAPVLLAGAVVAESAMRAVGAADILVSEADILDGIALGLLEE